MNFLIRFRSLFGTYEIPSVADISSRAAIQRIGRCKVIIDLSKQCSNIPWTEDPELLNIMEIPDTNSMDGLMDKGNNPLYYKPANEENHNILCDWIAKVWKESRGLQTVDAVYRIMSNPADDPADFIKPCLFYAIHRIYNVAEDSQGRYFRFGGINNPMLDPYKVRDKNILWLNAGVVY